MKRICVDCNVRTADKHRTICGTCKFRRYAQKHPLKYAFKNLKYNAKRRGKEFKLTFAEFCKFVISSTYIQKRGKEKNSFHIDRIDEAGAYELGNIQVLTNSENVKKYLAFSPDSKSFRVKKELKLDDSLYPF